MEILWFIVKFLTGFSIAIAGAWFDTNKKRKKMRIFDTLTEDCKIDILETAIGYAKADIEENNLVVDLIPYAVGFGEMFLLKETDFINIDPVPLTGWVGGRPPHRPKVW